MSIIHDALKKIQGKTAANAPPPAAPAATPDTSSSLFASATKSHTQIDDQSPIEYLPSKQKKSTPWVTVVFAIAFVLGAFWFLFKQLDSNFPDWQKQAKSWLYKLAHKKDPGEYSFPAKAPENLVPLAKISVNPTVPAAKPSLSAPAPANMPASAAGTPASAPGTLNIHGVMSQGSRNIVLINDQVYQEGDEVNGVKISKIDLKSVTVINNGKEETIRVK
jgi:hypothetical protein